LLLNHFPVLDLFDIISRKICPDAFSGFPFIEEGDFNVPIAEPNSRVQRVEKSSALEKIHAGS
jgi:hypothetical protein